MARRLFGSVTKVLRMYGGGHKTRRQAGHGQYSVRVGSADSGPTPVGQKQSPLSMGPVPSEVCFFRNKSTSAKWPLSEPLM